VYTEVTVEEKVRPLQCYSRLHRLLFEREMTVASLERTLRRRGVRVNLKTLYRLADPTTHIERLDTAVAGLICDILGVELSQLLSFEAVRRGAALQRLSPASQRRLDQLLERQSGGRLPEGDRRDLARLVDEAERLTLQNARALARARKATART
jgi:hypothetical protein